MSLLGLAKARVKAIAHGVSGFSILDDRVRGLELSVRELSDAVRCTANAHASQINEVLQAVNELKVDQVLAKLHELDQRLVEERAAAAQKDYFMKARYRRSIRPRPTVYVLTAFRFNHIERNVLLDDRFQSDTNFVFYFFDQEIDLSDFPKPFLRECDIYPEIAAAGRAHLAEWSFLLAEYHKRVLDYPFYMISSRFYEKNKRMIGRLDDYWDWMFAGLSRYGYGYLPSYDRNLQFIDILDYIEKGYLGSTNQGLAYLRECLGVDMLQDHRYVSDFWCNYIGFRDRAALERYIEFYLPLIANLFDPAWELCKDYLALGLVSPSVNFREYKPLSLLLEQASHMFFFKNKVPFYGLSYDGGYEVREWERAFERIHPLSTTVS